MELNILLLILNLFPIPPLDGFSVLGGFLTARQMYALAPLQQWGPILFLIIFVVNPGGISGAILNPPFEHIVNFLCSSACVNGAFG